MSDDVRSQGMTIGVGDAASPEVFTTIDGIQTIGGPTGTATVLDASDLSSTAKEKLIGLRDWGNFTLSTKYDPEDATHAQIRGDLGATDPRNYKITFADASPATTWDFAAYVTGFAVSAGVDAILMVDIALEINGDITEA